MTRLTILLFLPALASGGDFDWLEGCWVSDDKSTQEVWVIDGEQSLAGFSVSVSDTKVGFYELMNIRQDENGSWFFTAYPSGQASASFKAIQQGENSVLFANPDHDYPQEIRYERNGDSLAASVSLLNGVKPISFDKVACETP
jgi:hypothetical protein